MTTPLTPDTLAELRRLEKAVAPGEWVVRSGARKGRIHRKVYRREQDGETGLPTFSDKGDVLVTWTEVAQLIAAARNALPHLLDEVERLRHAHEDYERACQTVALMHEAAVGEVTGPKRGVVEDVEDVRKERDLLRAEVGHLREALQYYVHGKRGNLPAGWDGGQTARTALEESRKRMGEV